MVEFCLSDYSLIEEFNIINEVMTLSSEERNLLFTFNGEIVMVQWT